MDRTIPTVDQFMTRLPHTISSTASVDTAQKLMRKHQIRHLPVIDDGNLVGVVSQRDVHLIRSLMDVDATKVPVDDAMTRKVCTVEPSERIDRVAAKMAAEKIGSMLVVDKGEVQGIFTTIDALTGLFHVWKTVP